MAVLCRRRMLVMMATDVSPMNPKAMVIYPGIPAPKNIPQMNAVSIGTTGREYAFSINPFHPLDCRTQGGKFLFHGLIAAIQVIYAADLGGSLGHKSCQN